MSPDFPTDPRQALEASLTALILGELPADQAQFLREALIRDAELARIHERLKKTVELIRQVEAPAHSGQARPGAAPGDGQAAKPAQPEPLKLSERRRETLLAHFKTVPLPEMDVVQISSPRSRRTSWLLVGAAAVVVGLLAVSALLPALSRAKSKAASSSLAMMRERGEPLRAPVVNSLSEKEFVADSISGLSHDFGERAQEQRGKVSIVLPGASAEAGKAVESLGLVANDSGGQRDDDSAIVAGVPVVPAGPRVNFANPTEATVKLAQPSITASTAPSSFGGGFGGGGGGAPATPPPPAPAAEPVAQAPPATLGGGEQFAFRRRYGLERGLSPQAGEADKNRELVTSLNSSAAAGNRNAQVDLYSEQAGAIDPSTGLPTPSKSAAQEWSVSGNLRGYYDDKVAGADSARLPTLGDTPAFGTEFGKMEKPASAGAFTAGGASIRKGAGLDQGLATAEGRDRYYFRQQAGEETASSSIPADPQKYDQTFTYSLDGNEVALGRTLRDEAKQVEAGKEIASLPRLEMVERPSQPVAESAARPARSASKGETAAVDSRGKTQIQLPAIKNERLEEKRVLERFAGRVSPGNAPREIAKGDALNTLRTGVAPLTESLEDRGAKLTDSKSGAEPQIIDAEHKRLSGVVDSLERRRRELTLGFSANGQSLDVSSRLNEAKDAKRKLEEAHPEVLAKQKVPAQQAATDLPAGKPQSPPPVPQPEVQAAENAFSTFSLNVSDVSFKLAAASLEKGAMPEPGGIRAEEFINAFDYHDPEPSAGMPLGFAFERARYPFAQNRDLLRFSVKTAAQGRQPGRAINLVLLVDNSGSMERADRVRILREALRVLATQLQAQDKLSVITFSRIPHLWVDGISGKDASKAAEEIAGLTPEGGTNLEEAMKLAYKTAARHYLSGGINRIVLLTDGAANLGDVNPEALKKSVEEHRKQGIALDCFGIGWEGYNDDLLEVLSRNGDGRYAFINTPEEAATEFVAKLAGALQVAASDVKVQVEFNPKRVTAYRQIGYAKHQLTKEQFRDNTVDAAELAAAEAGNALYVVEVNPQGEGPLATVRARYKIPGSSDYREHEWTVPYTGNAPALEQSTPGMRLAGSAGAFAEWLASSPYAAEVTPDALLNLVRGLPQSFGADPHPQKLEWMIRQAKSISGK